jgi:hypothetical protein
MYSKFEDELVFQHDCKVVTANTVVSTLNWRNDDLVVIEAIKASDVVEGTTSSPLVRQPLRTITNPSVMTPTQKTDVTDPKPRVPKVESAGLKQARDTPAQNIPIHDAKEVSRVDHQQAQPASHRGWVDFACERRAYNMTKRPHNTAAEVAAFDASIRVEWLNFEPRGRDFFENRALKIGTSIGDWDIARFAFW